MVFSTGISKASSCRTTINKSKSRKLPYKRRRKKGELAAIPVEVRADEWSFQKSGMEEIPKRKVADEAKTTSNIAKFKYKEVVPNEGPSNP